MKIALARLATLGVAALLLAPALRATIVVDPTGHGDFTTLQAALLAAADGELILVKAGAYESAPRGGGFSIAGKGLALVAEAGARVSIPWLEVTGVPAGRTVVVRGLGIDPAAGNPHPVRPGVELSESAGTLWLEDCSIRGASGWYEEGFGWGMAQHGVSAHGGDVVLQRCTVIGGKGTPSTPAVWSSVGGAGVWVQGGHAALHDCTVTGGAGGDGEDSAFAFSDGGSGVEVWSQALASLAGCTVTGGSNGLLNPGYSSGYTGGGLTVASASAFAWVRASDFAAGAVVGNGHPGAPVEALLPGNVTSFAAPARSLEVSSPLREGQSGALQVHGQPGDQLLLLAAPDAGFAPLPGKQGALALAAPVLLPVSLGTITDPAGTLTVPFITPHLAPGLEGLSVLFQLGVMHDGLVTLEAGTALAWLDARFD